MYAYTWCMPQSELTWVAVEAGVSLNSTHSIISETSMIIPHSGDNSLVIRNLLLSFHKE